MTTNNENQDLINNILFEKETVILTTYRGSALRNDHFYCLNLYLYYQEHPKTYILTKFITGLIFIAFPLGVTSLLIKTSIDNPDNPKLYLSSILLISSITMIIIYIITLIVLKIMNVCRYS